ncbi:MAG: ATP-binding protein [Trueperaceae bacterium]
MVANAAALKRRGHGYLVIGVDDQDHAVVGTSFDTSTATHKGQNLFLWTLRQLAPSVPVEVHEVLHPAGRAVILQVGAAQGRPVRFGGVGYVRVGPHTTTLQDHPHLEAALWRQDSDWSATIVDEATLADLDPEAVSKARTEYLKKYPGHAAEASTWEDAVFLNKARVTRGGRITRTAILLLGSPESAAMLLPAVARVTWLLKDAEGVDLDYAHFDPPFILRVDEIARRVRNLTLRAMPSGTLFPAEIQQYDAYVLREALHNAVAHQDYGLRGRVQVVETPSRLLITNVGSFIPRSLENVLRRDAPGEVYRNPFLAAAMVNLNMIDTQGGGIRRMFQRQRERFMPLPDYDLSEPERVAVSIPGRILDELYSRLLMERADIDLWQALLLDRVQKGERIPHEAHVRLRRQGLVEGRYPRTILSGSVARATDSTARHIQARGLSEVFYRELVLALVREHAPVSRAQVDELLLNKLPDVLTERQKRTKVSNTLRALVHRGLIENRGSRRHPQWFPVGASNAP